MNKNHWLRRFIVGVLLSSLIVAGGGDVSAVSAVSEPVVKYPATEIAAGYVHTCALLATGNIKCWGYNANGQLGIGNNIDSSIPIEITGGALAGKTVTQIAAGAGVHTCALLSDATIACWGGNGFGQLGTSDTAERNIPVAITGGALAGKTTTQIAVGGGHTCALFSDSTVACWGNNLLGQLGIGNYSDSHIPVAVTGGALDGKTVTQISAGSQHTCALLSDATIACWGANNDGQLGTGITSRDINVPVAVSGGSNAGHTVTRITASGYHTCAVLSDGTVSCWGRNEYGQLGTGDTTNSNTPLAVTGGSLSGKTITEIQANIFHTCAVLSDGTVSCWGRNEYGQLGTGDTTNSNTPLAVTGGALTGKTVTRVSAGREHTCALLANGTVACWGMSHTGRLGNGSTIDSYIPVAVLWPTRAAASTKPTILGTARTGQRLRVNTGTWTGFPTPIYTYKWYECSVKITRSVQNVPRSCRMIGDATSSTFRLTAAQKGEYIAVRVTGTSTGFLGTSWLSKTSTKVR
jgi:alpha-tubulin suppressor-like RCC1 family protein